MKLLKEISTPFLLAIIVVVIVLDQWTKQFALAHLIYAQPITVLPVLDWTLLFNYGAAFSFLSDAGGWQRWLFTAISSLVSIVFFVWLWVMPKTQWLMRWSLVFVIAGALGNLIDRITLGYVIDFISVHWQHHYFPAFNIADSAITLGAGIMLLDAFFIKENKE